jgi:spermidine synthase
MEAPMQPWRTIDRVDTPEGPLELRQRGERDFLITIGGRVLMTSAAHRSEDALAEIACRALPAGSQPRVLVGGLGMGYTLRAALDRLPPRAKVDLVDLNEAVVNWCRGPLALLTDAALGDRRVSVEIADVSRVIAAAPAGSYDAILLDLYEGPHQATNRPNDPLYGATALARTHRALRAGGILAVWSEEVDRPFEHRLEAASFRVRTHRTRGGRTHVIYAATTG